MIDSLPKLGNGALSESLESRCEKLWLFFFFLNAYILSQRLPFVWRKAYILFPDKQHQKWRLHLLLLHVTCQFCSSNNSLVCQRVDFDRNSNSVWFYAPVASTHTKRRVYWNVLVSNKFSSEGDLHTVSWWSGTWPEVWNTPFQVLIIFPGSVMQNEKFCYELSGV